MSFLSKVAVLAACVGSSAGVRRKSRSRQVGGVNVHRYREGVEEWILLFKAGTSTSTIKKLCGGQCNLVGNPDAGGVAFAKATGSERQLEMMVSKHPEILDLLEPDSMDSIIPEIDEGVTVQEAASWGLDAVGVSSRPATGAGVHIYVQDTGIRTSHSDFGGRAIPTLDVTSGSPVDCSTVPSKGKKPSGCALDKQGHGTHCAGTAGGTNYGVASDAALHAVKTLSDTGSGARSWQMIALDWITVNGIKPAVISMSLGGSGADPSYLTSIGAATSAGITVVVAAGNSNSDSCNFSPAFVPDAITVGATASDSSRASYSNYGTCNDIMAPGSAITSASSGSDTGTNTFSGTSMACPHVSGAAAILLEQNPSLDASGILRQLLSTAKTGIISGLKTGDPEEHLYVGA